MRKLRLSVIAAILATIASQSVVNASFISGVVTFAGVALLDNANSALATQASIFLPTVVGVAGDFTPPILVGQTPTVTSPLVIGSSPATIWSLSGFTFTPSGPITGGGGPNNTFALGVSGIVDDGPGGFDPTPAVFALATTPTIGGLGAFASITASVPVPEPSTYLAGVLLLLPFGLQGIRSLRNRKTIA